VREVAEQRNPRTNATLDQLLERNLEQFAGAPNTRGLYEGHIRNHISPALGHLRVGQLTAETLDAFYGQLRRCRSCHKGRRPSVDHRTKGPHTCDQRCRPHECQPLAATTIRHIHFILSAAYKKGGSLALGERQSDRAGRTSSGTETQPATPNGGGGRPDRQRLLAGSRLGHLHLDRDDDRDASRRDLRRAHL
jgi:hypothetical protein